MSWFNRSRSPVLTATLSLLEAASLLGLVYCSLILAGADIAPAIPHDRLLVYFAWFTVSAVSVYAMLNWQKWGAYGLAIVTAAVTLVEVVEGTATLGGASLGLCVGVVLYLYLRPVWHKFE